jgi:outer membrane lipoprotein-sorting protein
MKLFRRLPLARLLAFVSAVTAVAVVSVVGIAAAVGGNPQPPPAKGLAEAVHDAVVAPPVQGVTARIEFKNNLVDAGAFEGVSPLISGASGRLWWTANHFRLELQGNSGDAQIVADDKSFWVYDGQSNTVYRGSIPADKKAPAEKQHGVPTVAEIQTKLTKVLSYAGIAGPDPGVEGGQPSYSVKVTPKQHGGLVGAVGLAWDATHGIPLRVGVYPKGASTPVLELKATDVQFGAVDPSAFNVSPPASAKVVDLRQPGKDGKGGASTSYTPSVTVLAGRKLSEARKTTDGTFAVYGEGLDSIVVITHKGGAASNSKGDHQKIQLGTANINGTTASVLETPLGTVLQWDKDGVTTIVAGSVTRDVAESAARGL